MRDFFTCLPEISTANSRHFSRWRLLTGTVSEKINGDKEPARVGNYVNFYSIF